LLFIDDGAALSLAYCLGISLVGAVVVGRMIVILLAAG
jgi:hypothetical protein